MITEKKDNGPQVLLRTLRLFDLLAESSGTTAADISKELGVTRQTVYALLTPLLNQSYIEKDEDSGKYRLGYKFYEFGKLYRHFYAFSPIAEAHAKKLSKATHMVSNVGIFKAPDRVLFIISADMSDTTKPQSETVVEANCSSCGKVLLAWMDEAEQAKTIKGLRFVRYTQNTICDEKSLLKELKEIRQQGFALERGELFSSKGCVGAPIRGADGRVIAAISVYGSLGHITEHEQELVQIVVAEAEETSRELGWKPHAKRFE